MASPVDPILSAYISGESGVVADITTRLTALNALISNYQTSQQQLSLAQQSVQSLNEQLSALTLDDSSAQKAVLSLTQQLQSAQQQVVTATAALIPAQNQLARVMQLTNPNVLLNLHRLPSVSDPNARPNMIWFQPGNSGNTGGASSTAHGTWSIVQNADGSTDYNQLPVAPFDDFIYGLNLLQTAVQLSHALQFTEFEIADEDVPNFTAIETNFENSINLFRKNAGIQALLGQDKDAITGKIVTNQWRYFDIASGHWFDTGIPFDRTMFGTGKRIQLLSEFVATPTGMTNLNLTINGTKHVLNKATAAKATTWGPYIQQAIQGDPLKALAMKIKVWNMETYWI